MHDDSCPTISSQRSVLLYSKNAKRQYRYAYAEWSAIMEKKLYEYDAVIIPSTSGRGGAFVPFPYDIREEFGKGRVKVSATFDGEPYDGSVVNMGMKNPDGSVCYIIGILKAIREKIEKQPGDTVHVTIQERE
jgi:hypothetical protein